MVVTILWMNSWAVVAVSLSVLIVIVMFLLFCTCWEHRKNEEQQFYVLDENGLQKSKMAGIATNSLNNINLFRRFSTANKDTVNRNYVFSAEDLPILESSQRTLISDEDLLDSIEASNKFENSVLKIVDNNNSNKGDADNVRDDMFSCHSPLGSEDSNSRYSFFSIYPPHLTRTESKAETFVSIDFTSDTERLLE